MKRILCLGLVSVLLCALLTFTPASAATIIDSGNCGAQGSNLKWTLDSEGILTISGTGEMEDYGSKWKYNRDKIKKVIINYGATNIGIAEFSECINLISVTIPNSVTRIGSNAFEGCSSLPSITIPNSVTSIYGSAFWRCSSLTSISIPNSVTDIYDHVFGSCTSLKDVKLPNNASLGQYIFEDCTALKEIKIPSGFTAIGERMFFNCSSLTNIEIPNTVETIGISAFYGCTSLGEIKIPSTVNKIGMGAFIGCTSLKELNLPNIQDGPFDFLSGEAFQSCTSLTNINVLSDNGSYVSKGGVLFSKDMTKLLAYPAGRKNSSYEIPNSVNTIDWDAFYNCAALTDIYIPKSVTTIDSDAFSGCENLKNVYYEGSESDWNGINISKAIGASVWYEDYNSFNYHEDGNNKLLNATIHYNSPMPSAATPTPKPTPTAKPTPTPTAKPTPTPTQKPTPVPTAKPTADPNAPSVEITEVSDYLVTAKVNNYDDFEAQVILAVYNKNGALIEMQNYSAWDEVWFFSTNLQNTNIKVMLWSDMDSMKPLAEPAEMSL